MSNDSLTVKHFAGMPGKVHQQVHDTRFEVLFCIVFDNDIAIRADEPVGYREVM
jgi:hypothetical protein